MLAVSSFVDTLAMHGNGYPLSPQQQHQQHQQSQQQAQQNYFPASIIDAGYSSSSSISSTPSTASTLNSTDAAFHFQQQLHFQQHQQHQQQQQLRLSTRHPVGYQTVPGPIQQQQPTFWSQPQPQPQPQPQHPYAAATIPQRQHNQQPPWDHNYFEFTQQQPQQQPQQQQQAQELFYSQVQVVSSSSSSSSSSASSQPMHLDLEQMQHQVPYHVGAHSFVSAFTPTTAAMTPSVGASNSPSPSSSVSSSSTASSSSVMRKKSKTTATTARKTGAKKRSQSIDCAHRNSDGSNDDEEEPFDQVEFERKRGELSKQGIKHCHNCLATSSSSWRRGGNEREVVLCNKCGLYWRDHHFHRPMTNGRALHVPRLIRRQTVTAGYCEHCHVTVSPAWRNGPEGRRFCNACGIYWTQQKALRPVQLNRPESIDAPPKTSEVKRRGSKTNEVTIQPAIYPQPPYTSSNSSFSATAANAPAALEDNASISSSVYSDDLEFCSDEDASQ